MKTSGTVPFLLVVRKGKYVHILFGFFLFVLKWAHKCEVTVIPP